MVTCVILKGGESQCDTQPQVLTPPGGVDFTEFSDACPLVRVQYRILAHHDTLCTHTVVSQVQTGISGYIFQPENPYNYMSKYSPNALE